MNLAIHGIEANLGPQPADSFLRNLHPDLKADYILANPPFNISDWSGKLLADDVRWRYGTPPVGNANYAWIQHFIHHLAPPNGRGGGVAGFVMANGSLSTRLRRRGRDPPAHRRGRPGRLHRRAAGPALPHHRHPRLPVVPHPRQDRQEPRSTAGATARARRSSSTPASSARCRPARCACSPAATTARACWPTAWATRTPTPTSAASSTPSASGAASPRPTWWNEAQHGAWAYRDIPGFCKAETIEGIAKHGFVLTPGRYVGAEEQEDDGEPFAEKYPRLLAELEECFRRGRAVDGGRARAVERGQRCPIRPEPGRRRTAKSSSTRTEATRLQVRLDGRTVWLTQATDRRAVPDHQCRPSTSTCATSLRAELAGNDSSFQES